MEELFVWAAVFSKSVSVPGDDIAVKARCDEETCVGVILDILHPAGVAMQRANL